MGKKFQFNDVESFVQYSLKDQNKFKPGMKSNSDASISSKAKLGLCTKTWAQCYKTCLSVI
jgi:hypothetical protein